MESQLSRHGVVTVRQFPAQRYRMARLARAGVLRRVHPGVYVDPLRADDAVVLLKAAQLWLPHCVAWGTTAAALWWPASVPESRRLSLAVATGQPGDDDLVFHRLRLPRDGWCRRDGLRLATPALAAVVAADVDGGRAIEAALRDGCGFDQMVDWLDRMPHLPGNRLRRRVLVGSRRHPWSAAERDLHDGLRAAGLKGWEGNVRLVLGGRLVVGDVLFERCRLVVEVDGYEYHSDRAAFEGDRERHNLLTAAGYTVLHVTWRMIQCDLAGVIELIRATRDRLQHPGRGVRVGGGAEPSARAWIG